MLGLSRVGDVPDEGHGFDPGAPEGADIVGELAVAHPEFRTRWAVPEVTTASSGTKHYDALTAADTAPDVRSASAPARS